MPKEAPWAATGIVELIRFHSLLLQVVEPMPITEREHFTVKDDTISDGLGLEDPNAAILVDQLQRLVAFAPRPE